MKIAKNNTNSELMLFIKKGSELAYKELYDRLWHTHYVLAFAVLGNESLAEDVVQDVWITLWERRKVVEIENIEAYLYRAIKLRSYKEIRNTSYREKLVQSFFENYEGDLLENDIENILDYNDTNSSISLAIEGLPNRCKEVFELSRFEDLKNSEIAEKLKISQRTVETHISNALKVLRDRVALCNTIGSLLFLFF